MTDNPRVFDHVTIRVSDRGASRRFYDTVLAPLGRAITNEAADFEEWNDFGIAAASAEHPVTEHLHVAFVARSRDEVDAFWSAGVEAGYRNDGDPGPRPVYHENYYGGFLLDPDGNSVEATYHGEPRGGEDWIDHLWIRAGDLEAARRFWSTVAPTLGFEVGPELPERFHVHGGGRSFALVAGGERTRNVHIAFTRDHDAGVREFHRAALEAGYRDNGAPGERPIYHPGYYGAFVLDPDGNNIEAVHHNR
jgi:catechol 2,3-dioxygenase-like lactoylglutathione lyase family enzyme